MSARKVYWDLPGFGGWPEPVFDSAIARTSRSITPTALKSSSLAANVLTLASCSCTWNFNFSTAADKPSIFEKIWTIDFYSSGGNRRRTGGSLGWAERKTAAIFDAVSRLEAARVVVERAK